MDEKTGKPEPIPLRAINTLSAFAAGIIFDKKLPTLTWTWDEAKRTYTVTPNGTVAASRLWSADAASRDFRQSRWTAEELTKADPAVAVKISGPVELLLPLAAPDKGFRASMVEVEFKTDNGPLHLCTQIRILEAKK